MLSKAKILEIASKITDQDELAQITAHFLLRSTKEINLEMSKDKGNDSETRANCILTLIDESELIGSCQDGVYQMMTEEFFDDVSRHMVEVAGQYITK
jgi:hypothetical protein